MGLGLHHSGVKGSRLLELAAPWPQKLSKPPRPKVDGIGVGQANSSVVLGTKTRGPQILHCAGL